MAKKITDRMLDVRVNQRYVKRGSISQKDLEGHIKALPDLADACEHMDLTELGNDEPNDSDNGTTTVQ